MTITRASRPRSAIYSINGKYLFVPTLDMWNVHEASKPSAILARAGMGRTSWFHQKRQYEQDHPGFWDWCYGSRMMPANDFRPTESMQAFRKEATIIAILAAATRPQNGIAWRKDYRVDVGEALLSYWRRMYATYSWFDHWLLRGEDAPPEVTVATAQQIQRCARGWDFATFCKRLGTRANATYVLWLKRKLIPNCAWLKWLYGAPEPTEAFVVSSELQRLRREMGKKAILKAVGLDLARLWQWERSPETSGPMKAILAGGDATTMEQWECLHANTRQHMEAIRKAMSLDECCSRAQVSKSKYYVLLAHADRCGVKAELEKYLKIEPPYEATKSRRSGLVSAHFFIPTPDMLRFREEAIREGAQQQIWSLQNLPGLDEWFIDWTAPKAYRGRRHLLTSEVISTRGAKASTAENHSARNDQAPHRGGRPRSQKTDAVYKFCYEQHQLGELKRSSILRKAQELFGNNAPKEECDVTNFARRYAKKHNLPFRQRS